MEKAFVAAPGARPHREAPLSAEEMVGMMNAVGVARAIIVPPSPLGDQNQTALEAVARYPDRFGIMGRFNPEASSARIDLESWLTQRGMLGIRLTFHKPQWSSWLTDGSLDWFWRDCERLSIPVMALLPGRLDTVPAIANRFPGLTLILDHMARPSGSRDAACFTDLNALTELARFPNVSVKASAAPCYSTEQFPFRNLTPYLHRIFDAFGPRRMMWGSDVTRLPCTYAECLEHFLYHLDFLQGEDKAWVMGKALSHLLRWPEPVTVSHSKPTE